MSFCRKNNFRFKSQLVNNLKTVQFTKETEIRFKQCAKVRLPARTKICFKTISLESLIASGSKNKGNADLRAKIFYGFEHIYMVLKKILYSFIKLKYVLLSQ